jgi:acetolactate synthase I/II/III large subunit
VIAEPLEPPVSAMQQIFELVRAAQKPILIAGSQVYWDEAHDALRELTDQTAMPVFTNGGGRGTLPMSHPHCFKLSRSKALKEADLALIIGTPLDFRLRYGEGWNPAIKLIQIENDAAELNHNRQADVALVANSRLVLEALAEGLARHPLGRLAGASQRPGANKTSSSRPPGKRCPTRRSTIFALARRSTSSSTTIRL